MSRTPGALIAVRGRGATSTLVTGIVLAMVIAGLAVPLVFAETGVGAASQLGAPLPTTGPVGATEPDPSTATDAEGGEADPGIAAGSGGEEAAGSDAPACDWPMFGRDPGHSFATPDECSEIGVRDAPRLRLKWFVPARDSVTASASVVDGTVYVGSWDGTFYALDAESGATRWTFEIDDDSNVSFGRIVSSAAVAEVGGTRVVVFGGGSTLYVLDAGDGRELSRLCLDPRKDPPPPAEPVRCRLSEGDIEVDSSPAIVDHHGETLVVVGHSVHNRPRVGRTGVVAARLSPPAGSIGCNTDPGQESSECDWRLEPVWKFDPETRRTYTPQNTDDPLTHEAGMGAGCGGVWSSPVVDLETERVFFGTANCRYLPGETEDFGAGPEPVITPGGHGGEAVWAVDLTTGAFLWTYSPRGFNVVDDDFGSSANLLPGGLVGIGGKDGVYYAFEREGQPDGNGVLQPRFATALGQPGRVWRNLSAGGMLGTPAVGEVNGEPAIFATTAIPTPIEDAESMSLDTSLLDDPGRLMFLHAISAVDGRILWRSPFVLFAYGSPTYSNGVLFVPATFDLSVKAFAADTGLPLWQHPLIGAPSSAAAIVGDSIYMGAGTRMTDLDYKVFGGDPLAEHLGDNPLSPLSGIFAFTLDPEPAPAANTPQVGP